MNHDDAIALRLRAARAAAAPGWVAWLLLAIGAVPLLLAEPAPLQDWPNHVAGAHVLAALLDGDAFWQRFYQFNTFLVPNAAVDLALLGLRAAGVPESGSASLFLLLTYAVFVGGLALLARALAAFDATKAALAVLLFYGAALFWGLANYVLGLGLMWAFLAIWLGLERHPVGRLAAACLGTVSLMATHAVPAVVFPLLLACFDLVRLRSGARLRSCVSAPLALAAAVLLLRLLPGDTGHDLALTYTGAEGPAAFAAWKLRIFATCLLGGSRLQDGATLAAVAGCVLAIGVAARPRLPVGAVLGVLALLLLALVAPERMGTGSMLDTRLAILPVMLAAAAVRLAWRSTRAARLCIAAVAMLVAGRTAVIAAEWWRASSAFAAYETAMQDLPAGSLMVMAYGRPLHELSWTDIWSPPIQSIAAQVVRRGVFFPALFANPDQQPIALRDEFRPLQQPWDFSDPAHRRTSLAKLAELCAGHRYTGVFVTILYGGPPFRIEDACDPAAPPG